MAYIPVNSASDLKDPFLDSPTGSISINNTSYSGSDIQLVLHIYNNNIAAKEKIAELDQEFANLISKIKNSKAKIELYKAKLAITKDGTPEQDRYNSILAGHENDLDDNTEAANSISAESIRLTQNMSVVSTKVLAEAQTISLSTHRIKNPVRALGKVYPSGFVRDQRDIAGSIIFTVFNKHVLYDFLEAHPSDFDSTVFSPALLDQLPPFDITIQFANEYGKISRMGIYGMEFVNEGQTMSIEDIFIENATNFVARDFDPMRGVMDRKVDDTTGQLMNEWINVKASDLLLEDDYIELKNNLNPFFRFNSRRNNFI